jgi:hypothetical protein
VIDADKRTLVNTVTKSQDRDRKISMTTQGTTSLPTLSSREHCKLVVSDMKARQSAKLREFREALFAAGLRALDQQAGALGLSRSTTWTILKGNHKGSGISAAIINRMLRSPALPPLVRSKILEYIEEKTAGLYGDEKTRLRKFTARLAAIPAREIREFVAAKATLGDPTRLSYDKSDEDDMPDDVHYNISRRRRQ